MVCINVAGHSRACQYTHTCHIHLQLKLYSKAKGHSTAATTDKAAAVPAAWQTCQPALQSPGEERLQQQIELHLADADRAAVPGLHNLEQCVGEGLAGDHCLLLTPPIILPNSLISEPSMQVLQHSQASAAASSKHCQPTAFIV